VHAHIRKWLGSQIGEDVAQRTQIIYGGSANAANCPTLLVKEDVEDRILLSSTQQVLYWKRDVDDT